MRHLRRAALGAALLALLVSACGPGGGRQASKGTIASQLILAGPPECPERPFCILGLTEKYGITFKEFKPTDSGGPITVEAIERGDAQVGVLYTSDPVIADKGFVLLEDDKQLQVADNLVPVVQAAALEANPVIEEALNGVMAKLSQAALTELNKQVTVDGEAAADVAAAWIEAEGLAFSGGSGSVTVGSTNFYEQEILGEVFAQVLEGAGIEVERKFQLGAREVVFPALESGEIDILAEYVATALEYVNNKAGEATTDPAASTAKLNEHLEPLGLVALNYAAATDQNGFVVTKETADKYGLVKLSDLAKPAP